MVPLNESSTYPGFQLSATVQTNIKKFTFTVKHVHSGHLLSVMYMYPLRRDFHIMKPLSHLQSKVNGTPVFSE